MKNILVIDDDKDVVTPLILFLESEGHTVRYAADGEEALKAVSEKFPDIIFLDIEMPKLTGTDMVYRLLVEDCGRENIPIVVLSGVNNIKTVGDQIGTPYYMAKPFHLDRLEKLLEKALAEMTLVLPSRRSLSRRSA